MIQRFVFAFLFFFVIGYSKSQSNSLSLETIIQTGHYGAVLDADFSNDGKLLATASADNTIILWEIATGRQLKTFVGHTAYVNKISFSPDKSQLLSVGLDNKAILWDISSGKSIYVFADSSDEVRSAIFSPKGTYILTGGHKTNAILWDRATGKKIKSYKSNPEVCYQCIPFLGFSSDENEIYTGSENNNIIIWNALKADTIATMRYATGNCSSCNSYMDIDGADKIVMADYSGHLYLVDRKAKKISKKLTREEEDFRYVEFNSDGSFVLTITGNQGIVKIWDVRSGEAIKQISDKEYKINAAKFSVDGKNIITAHENQTTKLWSIAGEQIIKEFKGLVTKIDDKKVGVFQLYYANQTSDTKLSPDGKTVAQCKRGNDIVLWDFYSGKISKYLTGHANVVTAVDFMPNSEVIASADADGVIKLWNIQSGKLIKSFQAHGGLIFNIRFSKDGKQLISASWDRACYVWDMATYKIISGTEEQSGSPYIVNFTPNGLYSVTASNTDKKISLTELDSKSEIKKFVGHTNLIFSLEFNPVNENIMLSSSMDGVAKLWNIESGLQIKKITGHKSSVHIATFDATGEFIVTGSADKSAKLWNTKTGELIRTFTGHTGTVNYAKITPDGKYLITASRDRTVKIWELATGKLLITHVTFENKQWVAKAEDGSFEGTPEALKLLYFVKNTQSFSLDQFFEKLYKPGLYKKALAMDTEKNQSINIHSLIEESPPPTVELLSQSTGLSKDQYKEVIIKVTNTGGGIDEIKFLHNGKRTDIPNQLDRALPKKDQDITLTYSLGLIPGKNQITISAFSKGRVESKPVTLEFSYEGAKKTSNLYLLAIGINEYKNPAMNLNYAKADAEAFIKSLEEKSKPLYNKIETFVLLDKDATKENILAKLNEIKQKAGKQDVLYLYYAGHGSTIQQEFYFIPTESVSLYQEDKLAQEAISATELNQKLKEIAALKQVVLLDACHSGTSTKILASRGLTEEKALAQLARSSGIHILAAAGSEQQAVEFGALGHGLFTYTLLQALNGKADGTPNDKKVTVYELKSYIDDQVPELSKQYQGTAQYPSTFSLGQDFPMVIIPEE